MLGQRLLADEIVVGTRRRPVGIEGELRVNEHLAPAWQQHRDVGATHGLARPSVLAPVVDAFDEPGMVEQALQLHLAPLATGLALGHGGDDLGGCRRQRGVLIAHRADLLANGRFGLCAALTGLGSRALQAVKALAHRRQ